MPRLRPIHNPRTTQVATPKRKAKRPRRAKAKKAEILYTQAPGPEPEPDRACAIPVNKKDLKAARKYVEGLESPPCGCPVYQDCRKCGSPNGAPCVARCRLCDTVWPPEAPACPGCGRPRRAETLMGKNGKQTHVGRVQNPRPCPLAGEPRIYRPACPHVLASDHPVSMEQWGQDYALLFPDQYGDGVPPAAPGEAHQRERRVEMMAMRRDLCVCGKCRRSKVRPDVWAVRHCFGIALRHKGDVLAKSRVGVQGEPGSNNKAEQLGLDLG